LKKYHFGWRDYDPELGRWNVADPARQFGSPYVAMANNPIGYYDKDGRWVWIVGMVIGAYLGGAAAQDEFEWNPGKWDWNDGSTYFGIIAGGAAGALAANAIAGPYGLEIGLNGTKLFTLGGDAIGAVGGGAIGGGSSYLLNQAADAVDDDNPESAETETSSNFFDTYRRYKNMSDRIKPGESKYYYSDPSNPNYWMERWQGMPYEMPNGYGDVWDCSYTCSQAYIHASLAPEGTRWTTTGLFGPTDGDDLTGWVSQNPSHWNEGSLIGWKYYNSNGELRGHMGTWTNNYRGMKGIWHNSVNRGLNFHEYNGTLWKRYVEKYGLPWGYK
jgi:hypothetical protein